MKSQTNCPKIYDSNGIIKLIYEETMLNLDMYVNFLINGTSADLISYMYLYLYEKIYDTPYGDMVPLVLANALGLNLIIISKSTAGRVCCDVLNEINNCLLVYKCSDHYDGIIIKANPYSDHMPVYNPNLSCTFPAVPALPCQPRSGNLCPPPLLSPMIGNTSTGIDADASKGETSPGYFNSKLVYSYRCGTIFPWEFPEISLAYSHIFMKGPSRSIIYGQIFWHPHPHPHIASPACIYHQNQLSFAFRFSFHLTIHFENAGNICNKIDL